MNTESSDHQFSIMTFNIRFGKADDGPNCWNNREKRYLAFFNKYQPDFIGLQEVNDFQVDFFRDILKDYDLIGQRIPAPSYWQDNIIFYKKPWKCLNHEHFFLSETPSIPSRMYGSKWPRQCVIGTFKKSNRTAICINTHFDFSSSVQTQSAKIIIEKLSGLEPSWAPVLITGDFNSEPNSPCYKKFVSGDIPSGVFKEVFHEEYSCTHHGFTGKCSGGHIDWILFRGSVALVEKEIIKEKFNGGYPSDHFPVYAIFQWK